MVAGGPDASRARLRSEVERVRASARRRPREPFDLETHERGGELEYLYQAGTVLVGDVDLDRVQNQLRAWSVDHEVADPVIGGLTLLAVDTAVPGLVDRLDAALGVGVVTPNHVLDVQGPIRGLCPADEPVPATVAERWPVSADTSLGADVRVAVVDTGFLRGYDRDRTLPWLRGVDRFDVDDDAYVRAPGAKPARGRAKAGQPREIAPYGGHGTFSAGVVLSVAPAAGVSVDDVLVGGVVDEVTIVRQLVEALEDSPDVLSVSAGTYTRKNVPPKAFVAFYEERLRHHGGVALVAAAGNNGDRTPFWPAAFPWAMAVGALNRQGDRRTEWSNHGGWVDVYAPGEDIVNAFPEGYYVDLDGQRHDFPDRMARWSGTSFSTPVVAGMVARRMSQTGENGQEAVESLRRVARQQFLPGVGPRLLP